MRFKITELAFVQRFWSNIEKPHVNRDMLKLSKFTSFTVFLDLVNRYFSFSEFFVVREPSVLKKCQVRLTLLLLKMSRVEKNF